MASEVEPIESVVCDDLYVEMSHQTCEILRGMISKASVNGAQFILLNPPHLNEASFPTPACFSDVIYVDGNDWPVAKTLALYYDDHHLLDQGSSRYSAWLSEELRTIAAVTSNY